MKSIIPLTLWSLLSILALSVSCSSKKDIKPTQDAAPKTTAVASPAPATAPISVSVLPPAPTSDVVNTTASSPANLGASTSGRGR